MTDRMTVAERAWMDGRLDSRRYFAMAERERYSPRWLAWLHGWWTTRRL
jgi:hypothetical protein